jgi:vitamin K-dependent gamma-carboxylase
MIQREIATTAPPMIRTQPRQLVTPWAHLFAPVDIAYLVVFRIFFGAIMLWEVGRYFAYGWIGEYYIEPTFYFSYFGFDWVKPWPGVWMYLHFFLMGALAVCIIVGLWYRAAAALFFLCFTYVALLDQTHYLNHFYLVSLVSFIMIFVPANRAFSIDSLADKSLRSNTALRWTLWLLRTQIGLVYFFGGVAKLNGDWLRGEPMRMWLADRTHFPLIGHLFTEERMVYAFSYGGLLFDLVFFPLVLWKRTRWLALVVGMVFHLTNARLFNIGIFPWFMLAASLLFLDPSWPRFGWLHRFVAYRRSVPPFVDDAETQVYRRDLKSPQPMKESAPNLWQEFVPDWLTSRLAAKDRHGLSTRQRVTLILLGIYMAWQILMPLRHFLYPGDVSWTEQGHRFAWHMKLRDKDGEGRFFATDVATGTTWEVDPGQYINREQFNEMIANPEMILQFAHHIAAERIRAGEGAVEVRAWVEASLNGRAPQLLIDSQVNLAAQPRTLLAADWILPLQDTVE